MKTVSTSSSSFYSAKYLLFFTMLLMTLLLSGTVTAYKVVHIGYLNLPASSILFPFSYVLGDVITEVYGYRIMRQLIWFTVVYDYIFLLITSFILSLPSPSTWHYQREFSVVFGNTWLFTTAASLGLIVSSFLNSYTLAKWKILTKGKYFWFRSFVASSFGDFIHVCILYPLMFWTTKSIDELPALMLSGIIYRVCASSIATVPATVIMSLLKRLENLDTYDYGTNFNPFKL